MLPRLTSRKAGRFARDMEAIYRELHGRPPAVPVTRVFKTHATVLVATPWAGAIIDKAHPELDVRAWAGDAPRMGFASTTQVRDVSWALREDEPWAGPSASLLSARPGHTDTHGEVIEIAGLSIDAQVWAAFVGTFCSETADETGTVDTDRHLIRIRAPFLRGYMMGRR